MNNKSNKSKEVITPEVITTSKVVKKTKGKVIHYHKHLHIHITKPNSKPKPMTKPKPKQVLVQKKCLMCNTYKKMSSSENYCSQNCFNKYLDYVREKRQKEMQQHYEGY